MAMHNFGERAQLKLRIPHAQLELLDELAEADGLHLGTWLVREVCEKHDIEVPEYVGKLRRRSGSGGAVDAA